MSQEQDFIFDENEVLTYDWPVKILKPGQDKAQTVWATFECVPSDELKLLEEQSSDEEEANAIVKRITVDWGRGGKRGFRTPKTEANPNGALMECNDENKDKIFNQMYISRAFLKAFIDSQGGKKAARKN